MPDQGRGRVHGLRASAQATGAGTKVLSRSAGVRPTVGLVTWLAATWDDDLGTVRGLATVHLRVGFVAMSMYDTRTARVCSVRDAQGSDTRSSRW